MPEVLQFLDIEAQVLDAETDDQNDSDEGVYYSCNVDSTLLILSKVFLSTMNDMDMDKSISGDAH